MTKPDFIKIPTAMSPSAEVRRAIRELANKLGYPNFRECEMVEGFIVFTFYPRMN